MTQTQPRYEHVNDHVELRLTRLGGHDVLDALNDRLELLEHLEADGMLLEDDETTADEVKRVNLIIQEIEAQLNEVREVAA